MQIETIQNIQSFNSRNSYELFFPNIVNEWNKLDVKITNTTSQYLTDFIEFYSTVHCDTFEIHNPA